VGLTQDFQGMIEPDDSDWERAPGPMRKTYYEAGGKIVLDEHRKQLAKGIGASGSRMKPRIQAVLPDGADGPVMEPHYDGSRVITLADYAATESGLKLFWQAGTGHADHRAARAKGKKATPFGEILQWHADGEVPNAPARDVRLSQARIANVKRRLEPVWQALKKGLPVPALEANVKAAERDTTHNPFGSTPFKFPAPIAARGIMDASEFTFGIGASKAEFEAAVKAGTTTGFRQLPGLYKGRNPPPAPKGAASPTPRPKPAPRFAGDLPRPAPYRIAAKHKLPPPPHVPLTPGAPAAPGRTAPLKPGVRPAAAKRSTVTTATAKRIREAHAVKSDGLTFVHSYHAQTGHDVVIVHLPTLHADLARDVVSYVGPGGKGAAKPGSYEGAVRFLGRARSEDIPVEMPRLGLDANGQPVVIDGRHRLAAFLAQGTAYLPVSVHSKTAAAFRRQYGRIVY
jgi:hypothetical protein